MIFKKRTLMYSAVMRIRPIFCHLVALKLILGYMFLERRLMEKL